MDSNKFLKEHSVLLGYNAASLGNWCPTFLRYVISAVLGAVYCGTGCWTVGSVIGYYASMIMSALHCGGSYQFFHPSICALYDLELCTRCQHLRKGILAEFKFKIPQSWQ